MTRELILTNGAVCLLDDDWFELLSLVRWNADRNANTTYAMHRERYGNGRRHFNYMHRLIMDAAGGQMVDHINGNGLDNRRSNLRLVTDLQNCMNRVRNRYGSSRYKGVTRCKHKWQAQIKLNGKMHFLGLFESEDGAGSAYNAAAVRLFGQYAKLNQVAPVRNERGRS